MGKKVFDMGANMTNGEYIVTTTSTSEDYVELKIDTKASYLGPFKWNTSIWGGTTVVEPENINDVIAERMKRKNKEQ